MGAIQYQDPINMELNEILSRNKDISYCNQSFNGNLKAIFM